MKKISTLLIVIGLIVLGMLALLITSYMPPPMPSGSSTIADDDGDFTLVASNNMNYVYRFVDKEAEEVCWIFIGMEKGGLSCRPLSETALAQ